MNLILPSLLITTLLAGTTFPALRHVDTLSEREEVTKRTTDLWRLGSPQGRYRGSAVAGLKSNTPQTPLPSAFVFPLG